MDCPDQYTLSIIIPTFNRRSAAATISDYQRALRSAFRNKKISFEIVVVDDCSEALTRLSVEENVSKLSEVKYCITQKNLGPGLARDNGLSIASGEWIWFLDDDDELNSENLDILVNLLCEGSVTEDVIAHSLNHNYFGDSGKVRAEIEERILLFQERQEVFNYLIKSSFLRDQRIAFSTGFHEDISYLFKVIRNSNGVRVVSEEIVSKNCTPGAITSKMTRERIDGYINAFSEIISTTRAPKKIPEASFSANNFFSQTLGVILYLLIAESDERAAELLDYLKEKSSTNTQWGRFIDSAPFWDLNASNFKYAGSFWRENMLADSADLTRNLRDIFNTRLSCKDLDSSLFLGPDEIRACCKRFFVRNQRKGDVVLLKADETINLDAINAAKDSLISKINSEDAPECDGCPYIERRNPRVATVDYVSLENFSYCNMRCTYCSPKYYGGTEARYNAAHIIHELTSSQDAMSEDCHIVWGGGEPTLSPRFVPINNLLLGMSKVKKMRILSNSLKYSEALHSVIEDPRVQIVTSIDAGTQIIFREIRGKGNISSVIQNLQEYYYSMSDKRRLTLKYILMSDNLSSSQLVSFVSLVSNAGLMDAMFQISCDFTIDAVSSDLICAMYELSSRLCAAGAKTIFFDDLVRDRVKISNTDVTKVENHLNCLGLENQFILWPSSNKKIILWGHGLQSAWYSNSTVSGRSGNIVGVVSNSHDFNLLRNQTDDLDLYVFPAGVQSMYEIVKNIENAELSQQLFRGVII